MIISSFDLGTKNFAFLIAYINDYKEIKILEWENIDVSDDKWFNVLQNVNDVLYDYSALLSICDVCLVEKQMTRLNMKASKLSYHVMSFFNIIWPHVKVIEYSAAHKTHTFTHKKMIKKERKMYCVNKTIDTLLFKKDYDNLAELLCNKKMDDKCDTYQMVDSYLQKYVNLS
jgi:hypothetical protein